MRTTERQYIARRRVVAAGHVLCCCEFLCFYVGYIARCWLFLILMYASFLSGHEDVSHMLDGHVLLE